MDHFRKLLAALLAFVLILSVIPAAGAEPEDTEGCIRQMLNYYVFHQDAAETDIERLCQRMEGNYPTLAEAWRNIMRYWDYACQDMEIPVDVLPDGLPEDDSLCIVVLGYALNSGGSMKEELVGRLEVTLASAEKYPNAYILCTGGGTASRAKSKTEAGQMAKWLKKNGIAEERIIIEDESLSTIQNAQFSCAILEEDYPQIRHLAIVTSDYHVIRGCVYFNTQLALNAWRSADERPEIVGCAAYPVSRSRDSLSYLASGIAQLAGTSYDEKNASSPALSRLTGLNIDGEFTLEVGTAMTLTATAVYDTGFSKDVTALAEFSGVDMGRTGEQLLTVSYTENGIKATAELLIDVAKMEKSEDFSQAVVSLEAVPASEDTPIPAADKTPPMAPFLLLAALLTLLALLLAWKIRGRK